MAARTPALIILAGALILGSCGGGSAAPPAPPASIAFEPVDTGSCDALFGDPTGATGLDDTTCRPELRCEGADPFVPPAYDAATIDALRARTLVDPPQRLAGDPYEDPALLPADTGGVCAVLPDPGGYRLATFPDAAAAEAAGGTVTHTGACGVCSTLQDLAVYLGTPNLGDPVRECALIGFGGDPEGTLACILDLGFTEPCAQIWAFNSANTGAACRAECLAALGAPNHLPDGTLNDCLACDERESGPVFKAVAGRTRRNSGIPSGICRPGGQVSPILHDAYP
jgi:hypothetical protein